MLKGQELIAQIDAIRNDVANAARVIPQSEIVLACGYVKENGKPDFIAFYTELLDAKGYINGDKNDFEEGTLAHELAERYDSDAVQAFIDYWGEEYLEHFEDAYQSAESTEDFARDFVENIYGVEVPSFVEIDWSATWDNLRHDFIELDGYIFSQNW